MGIAIAPITVATLRHLSIHGTTSVTALKAAVPGLQYKTIGNLVQLSHVFKTEAGYCITPKGRSRLTRLDADPTAASAGRSSKAKPEMQAGAALDSNRQTEQSILDTLRRATTPITLAAVAERMGRSLDIVRPSLTLLVQAGSVVGSAGKPVRYRLPENVFSQQRARTRGIHSASVYGRYLGGELQRNPGIRPERFVAFALPSRMGDRLHWPDGRITHFSEHPGLPA